MTNEVKSISVVNIQNDAIRKEKERNYDEAIKLYQIAISNDENSFDTYSRLGALYERVRDFINAKEVYKKAIAKARQLKDSTWEREFSYTLLGLVD